MPTECSAERVGFGEVSGRVVVAGFDDGAITSDAGAPPVRSSMMCGRACCSASSASRSAMMTCSITDQLRHDPALAVLTGKLEARRAGCAPHAGKSTLNRPALSREAPSRYHRISHDPAAIEALATRRRPRPRLAPRRRRLTRPRYRKPPFPKLRPATAAPGALGRNSGPERPGAQRYRWQMTTSVIMREPAGRRDPLPRFIDDAACSSLVRPPRR